MNFEKKVEELHDKAMELADLGFISKKQGKQQEAIAYFSQAYKSEEKAANLAYESGLGQPTVGILFRSAITLASDASDIGKILSLIKEAITTGLWKEQQTEILELIAQKRIRLHSLDETEIDNLIYGWKVAKLRRELSSKSKRDHQKRKNGLGISKRNHKTNDSYQFEHQRVTSLL